MRESRFMEEEAAKEFPGHESIEMTLRYAHLSPDVKREAVPASIAGRGI